MISVWGLQIWVTYSENQKKKKKSLAWYYYVNMPLEMFSLTCIFVRNNESSQISQVI